MAIRPIYISTNNLEYPFISKDIEFKWVNGTSVTQNYKRRDSLKSEIAKIYDINEWLEVSTKSDKELGIKLSALNLHLVTKLGNTKTVEEIYQSSKVFENGKIVKFKFGTTEFPNTPYGMYYDYLYMIALYQNKELHEKLKQYNIFTDIKFNPNKSLNTQARAVSIFKTLLSNDMIDIITKRSEFEEYYKRNVKLKSIL